MNRQPSTVNRQPSTVNRQPMKNISLALAIGLALSISLPTHAELILSGNPSSQERTEVDKNFTALAAQLTLALGEPVRYVAPVNVQGYAQDIRNGKYDILIDGPHLGAWRISRGLHKPIAQSGHPSTFLVVTAADNRSITSLEQLIDRPVCIAASPNLSNLMFFHQYPNPMQLPITRIMQEPKMRLEKLLNGECAAAVIAAPFFETKLDQETKNKLNVLYNTPPLPGHIMTVGDKLSAEKREALIKRITGNDPAKDTLLQAMTRAAVNGGSPEKMRWLSVKSDSIKGLEQVLIQQSYGWN